MTLRNLRNIHPTRNSCRDTLPWVICHLNYLSFLPLTEKPLIYCYFEVWYPYYQFSECNQKSLFPESSKWQITSEKTKKEKIVMEAKFDSEFEKQCMDTMCIYLYTTFFYLNSIYIYIYIYNTKFASPCLYLTCFNCRYVCLVLCLFISSFLNLIYFIISYIYYLLFCV